MGYNKAHYEANKEKYYEKAAESRYRFLEWFKNIKSGLACQECGETHPACLQFHHRNRGEKTATVSELRASQSRRKVLAEIAKCDVLCANCHAKLHWDESRE